ncbi:phosphotransferase family protein, partial [Aspergillus rambellii]
NSAGNQSPANHKSRPPYLKARFLQIRNMKTSLKFSHSTPSIPHPSHLYSRIYRRYFSVLRFTPEVCLGHNFLPLYNPQSRIRLRLMRSSSTQQSCTDFFRYTSGRWLWDEEQQLRDRFSPFNIPELQKVAASSVGAKKCVTITKLAEGSFNKTFRLMMDNGMTVIARIPHPIAGPQHYTTASEVATMEFARSILEIPVPRIYAWSADVKNPDDPLVTSATQNSPESHILLLQKYLEIVPYLLPDDPAVVASHLWHTDLHSGNIFVDRGRICSVIDWQGTWAAPLILQARHPRLVDYHGEIILKAPPSFKDLEPAEKARIAKQVPLLDKVLHFDHGRTRCEPIQFVGDTWDNDILPLRESLIRIEKYWDELGFKSPCPIHFTQDELRIHAEEGEGWNDVQDFWNSVSDIISRDGWMPIHLYDDAVALFTELREAGLKSMLGKEREDFKRQTQWIEKT